MKTRMTELDALAKSEGLVWRQQVKKGKLGPAIQADRFPNKPYHALWIEDRATVPFGRELVYTAGYMKLKRGVFYLCATL